MPMHSNIPPEILLDPTPMMTHVPHFPNLTGDASAEDQHSIASSDLPLQDRLLSLTQNSNQMAEYRIVVMAYEGKRDDELSLEPGQILRVLKDQDQGGDPGWAEGIIKTSVGWFPVESYTEPLDEIPNDLQHDMTQDPDLIEHYRIQTMLSNADRLDNAYTDDHPKTLSFALTPEEKSEQRAKLISEFVRSEDIFIGELDEFIRDHRDPQSTQRWLSEAEHSSLMESLDDVANFHHVLFSSMSLVAAAEPQDQMVGGYFLDFVPFFSEVYLKYKTKLPQILTMAIQAESFIPSKFQPSPLAVTPVLHFTASLHKPFQNIQKTIYFLRKVLEATPLNHDDRVYTVFAWRSLREAVAKIEVQAKNVETRENIRVVMKKIDQWEGPSLENYGTLIRYGPLEVGDKRQMHYFYLLERILVILRAKPTSLTLDMSKSSKRRSGIDSLAKFKVAHKILLSANQLKRVSTNDDVDDTFFRIAFCSSDETLKTIDCFALNKEIRNQWVVLLNSTVEHTESDEMNADLFQVSDVSTDSSNKATFLKKGSRVAKVFSLLTGRKTPSSDQSRSTSPVSLTLPDLDPTIEFPYLHSSPPSSPQSIEKALPSPSARPRKDSLVTDIDSLILPAIDPMKDLPGLPEDVSLDSQGFVDPAAFQNLVKMYQEKLQEIEVLREKLGELIH